MNAFFCSFIGVYQRGPRYIFVYFIQNVLRSTLLHANKTTKKCIQFLNNQCDLMTMKNNGDKRLISN